MVRVDPPDPLSWFREPDMANMFPPKLRAESLTKSEFWVCIPPRSNFRHMPELPEVEILVRHLRGILRDREIRSVQVRRAKVIRPFTPTQLRQALVGWSFTLVRRRGKYLVFTLRNHDRSARLQLLGHLGMTGRIYVQERRRPLARHAAVVFDLSPHRLVFEDTRYFGRLSLDLSPLDRLGPEPLSPRFTIAGFAHALQRSTQPIKVRLLDQSLVAGIGNIYASEALFNARIHPELPACSLTARQVVGLRRAIRVVLANAIRGGSTVPLDWAGANQRDRLFYYGRAEGAPDLYQERLRVYDRARLPCRRCRTPIRRITQANRSTYYCPECQNPGR